ncbi:permease, partial [Methylococcaceae bacterium CS1]
MSDGKINDFTLRLFVAVGVAAGIALGSYRIVVGDSIHYYIIVGYLIVVILTMIAPKYIIPIAFDSGGVTTSTVTVPLVAALGLGLASNIEGRDPLVDGFGLIAFASLFPMLTVMAYGIITDRMHVKGDHELAKEEEKAFSDLTDSETLHMINIDGSEEHTYLDISFSAVYTIVPSEKVDDAILAAKSAGAGGVTVMEASGTGLRGFDNFYRQTGARSDNVLVFVLPENLVHRVVHELNIKLHLSTDGSGLVYSLPIEYMKGISISQNNIDEILEKRKADKK